MRILVISNYFPPYFQGGFELSCRDFVEGLRKRDHTVLVLTSTYGIDKSERQEHVWRTLPDPLAGYPSLLSMLARDWRVKKELTRASERLRPAVILAMGLDGLGSAVFQALEELDVPTVYVAFDKHLVEYQEVDRWYRTWNRFSNRPMKARAKSLLRSVLSAGGFAMQPTPRAHGVVYGSYHLRQAIQSRNLIAHYGRVVYPPIRYYPEETPPVKRREDEPLRLLYIGRIDRVKGIHTIVNALIRLQAESFAPFPFLDVVGHTTSQAYEQELRQTVAKHRMDKFVQFVGQISPEEVPSTYRQHHAVIFATEAEEHFGMVPLEAMIFRVAVISTATGGAREYLVDGRNALVFPPGDSDALAQHIVTLTRSENMRRKLGLNGYSCALSFADMESRVTELEEFLQQVASGGKLRKAHHQHEVPS